MFESEDFSFTINEEYAARFEHNKKREELQKLQEKYGKDAARDEDTSSGSEEDEDAMYDSVAKDKDFLRVLSKLKSKDPAIYDKEKNWFEEEEEDKEEKRKKEKPIFLKDYERETLLTKGSLVVDSDDDAPDAAPTYTAEQRALKEGLKLALNSATSEGEEPVLTLRTKTSNEKEKEEGDYRKWLKGEKTKIKDTTMRSDCDYLHQTWSDPNLADNERFLRDFILNKGWVEESDRDFVPSYDEIVNDDDEEVDKHEVFERKFNFRFEEPDHELIKNYPRTIANSVRKSNESRKEKRKRKEERKLKEKEERRQEIDRLKKLKLEEIERKLELLSESAGADLRPALQGSLEEDFNPEEHDKVMSKLFDEDYYNEQDPVKPVFSDSDEDLINDEEWFDKITQTDRITQTAKIAQTDGQTKGEPVRGDCEGVPTVIYRENVEEEEEERTRKKSWKRKRSKKFKEAVVRQKPSFNPEEGPWERYYDEYYKLECEDVIGDVKCRFGYRKTTPCTYGLTLDEIVMADDKELNQWFSFKKMMKYRTPGQEAKDGRKFQNKRHNEFMKRQILKSLYPDENPTEQSDPPPPRNMKKAVGEEPNQSETKPETTTQPASDTTDGPTKKKKKKKVKVKSEDSALEAQSADRAQESPVTKKKKKTPETVEKSRTSQNEARKKGKQKKSTNISQSRLEAYGLS